MTENKRFIPIFDGTDKRVVGAKDNGKIISFMGMFELLNELHEENVQLKSTLKELKEISDYQQGRIKELNQDSITNYKQYKKLLNENEQLKEEIKDLNDILARYEEKELE